MNYLIIGGNSAIGKAIIQRIMEDGHHCTIISRSDLTYDGTNVEFHNLDILNDNISEDMLPEQLDGLVYMPGTITLKPFRMLKPEDFISDFEINLLGAVKAMKVSLKPLGKSKQASIVMFSTVAVQTGMQFHSSIAAAKGAVEGFTRSLAAEFAPKIRVNCVAPSLTDTPLAAKLLSSEQKRKGSEDRHPLKAVGDTEDIAEAAYFLLTSRSKWMTGQVIGVDGGLSTLKV